MVKYIGLIRLKPEQDPDKMWELWQAKYSIIGKEILLPELKQYSINRVIETIGESNIYGFSEMIFDDAESCKRAFKRRLGTPPEIPWNMERIIAESKNVPLP
ncbi:hypothetical protein ACFLV3_01800 [Chloroflexota bacterium]